MTFLYPSVFWFGLPVIAIPAIIHLLHLRRQRKIAWPAMQFLLESQEQSRRWINLQEMLLLLLRTLALAIALLMLAGPTTRSGWLSQFVERPVHHLIILDDSYSMTDRWADTSVWREAIAAATQVVRAAADQSQGNVVSVLLHSEAGVNKEDPRPGLFRRVLDAEGLTEVVSRIEGTTPSDKSPRLEEVLQQGIDIAKLQSPEQELVVYLVGDFRARDMAASDEVSHLVKQLSDASREVRLVRCVRQSHDNLAITRLEPESGVRASGVEMWMTLGVQNFGAQTAREVIVELLQDGNPLVAVPLGDLPAGELVESRFRVAFSGDGPHWLEAAIEADAVEVDNRRRFATLLPEAQKVLLVDGSPQNWESYYLSTAINPGGTTKSGWQPRVIKPNELKSIASLEEYAIVCLLDVPRIEAAEIERIERYVAEGGGLYVTLGESIDRRHYAEDLFRKGDGWLPAPPSLPTQWVSAGAASGDQQPLPDLRVTDHPLFRIFQGERNSMLALMRVNYYYALAGGWQSQVDEKTRVIATLGRSVPLLVEKQFGAGTVVMQTTRISPDAGTLGSWSNWGPNPAFVVFANDLMGTLASSVGVDQLVEVGKPAAANLSPREFAPTGKIASLDPQRPFAADLTPESQGEQLRLVSPPLARGAMYSVTLDRLGGGTDHRYVAANVDPREGDLALAADTTLRQKLAFNNLTMSYADELRSDASGGSSSWTGLLLAAIVIVLVAEQGLAYVASFHE